MYTSVGAERAAAAAEVERLETLLPKLEQEALHHRVMATLGDGGDEAPPDVAAVRAALTAAREQLDIMNRAQRHAQDRLRTLADEIGYAERTVRDYAREVVREEVEPAATALAASIAERRTRLMADMIGLQSIARLLPGPPLDDEAARWVREANWTGDAVPAPIADQWRVAFAALLDDPSSPLPV